MLAKRFDPAKHQNEVLRPKKRLKKVTAKNRQDSNILLFNIRSQFTSDITSNFGYNVLGKMGALFQTFDSSLVKRNIVRR